MDLLYMPTCLFQLYIDVLFCVDISLREKIKFTLTHKAGKYFAFWKSE